MNGKELLDELQDQILRDVSDSVGGASDRLWSRAALIRYLNEGYNRFARQTLLLRDATTPALVEVTLVAGQASYALSPKVVAVLSAKVASKGYPMKRTTHENLNAGDINSTAPPPTGAAVQPGEPFFFTTDEAVRTLTVYPPPSDEFDGELVQLRVCRLPLKAITEDTLDAELELPADYHLDIAEWAAYRAYRNHDVDAESMTKAERHKARFTEAVGEAKQEAKRQMFAPLQFHFAATW